MPKPEKLRTVTISAVIGGISDRNASDLRGNMISRNRRCPDPKSEVPVSMRLPAEINYFSSCLRAFFTPQAETDGEDALNIVDVANGLCQIHYQNRQSVLVKIEGQDSRGKTDCKHHQTPGSEYY